MAGLPTLDDLIPTAPSLDDLIPAPAPPPDLNATGLMDTGNALGRMRAAPAVDTKAPPLTRAGQRISRDSYMRHDARDAAAASAASDAVAAENAKPGYLMASSASGLSSLGSAAAQLFDAINPYTTSDADLAVLYKNDPEGLAKARSSGAAFLSRVSGALQDASEKQMQGVNPAAKAAYSGLQYATLDPSKAAYLSPVRVFGDAIQSLPTTAALALTAFLTRGASMEAESAALASGATQAQARLAGTQAAIKMAEKFGAVSEGAIGYGQQKVQTESDLNKVSSADFAKYPAYQELIKAGYDPIAARLFVTATAGEKSGITAGMVDTATNMIGGHFLGKIIGEGGSLLKRSAKGVANEGATEAVQSAGEQLGQNLSSPDPNQDPVDGVLESTLQGMLVGGLTGGATAGVFGHGEDHPAAGTEGHIDQAVAAASIPTPEDEASPIPTDLITQGRATVARAQATQDVSSSLEGNGLPGVGKRVGIDLGNGRTLTGTMGDTFTHNDPELGAQQGIRVALDDGTSYEEFLSQIQRGGVKLSEMQAPSPEDIISGKFAPPAPDGEAAAPEGATPATAPIATVTGPAILPVEGGHVTSPFGKREAPIKGATTNHQGIDIAVPVGTPVKATGDGTVIASGSDQVNGNFIRIQHGDGYVSSYAHLSGSNVRPGETVTAGQEIGQSGATGRVTGPHLHYAVKKDGAFVDPSTVDLAANVTTQEPQEAGNAEHAPELDKNGAVGDQGDLAPDEPVLPTDETQTPETAPQQAESAAPAQVEPLTDKSVMLRNATPEQLKAIKAALPDAVQPMFNTREQAHVWSAKHAPAINNALSTIQTGSDTSGTAFQASSPTGPASAPGASSAADPQLDWDSRERDDRAALLSKTRMVSADMAGKIAGASYDELAPDLKAAVGKVMAGSATPAALGDEGTRAAPVVVETAADLRKAEAPIADGSDAQREAGNHQMGHAVIKGMDVTLEIPKGGERRGTGPDGKPWSTTIPAAYGYIKKSTGADAENFDVYVGDHPASNMVYVVDQVDPKTGRFDEHKGVIGARSMGDAAEIYRGAFSDGNGAKRIGGIKAMSVNEFQRFVASEPKGPVSEAGKTRNQGSAKISPTLAGGVSVDDAARAARERIAEPTAHPRPDGERQEGGSPSPQPETAAPAAQPDTTQAEANPAPSDKPTYGADNKLVSRDRAAEIRKKLTEKFKNLNSGIDPETLALGTELAVYHIEAGARRFVDFASKITADLGITLQKARPFLRSWYNGARDMMEDHDIGVAGMDSPDQVRIEMAALFRQQESGDGLQGAVRDGDAAAGAKDVQRTQEDGGSRQAPVGQERGGAPDRGGPDARPADVAERSSEGPAEAPRGRGASAVDGDRVPVRGADTGHGRGADTRTSAANRVKGENWHIEPGSLDESRSPAAKARDNVFAIQIVKALYQSGLPATREQQAALAKYVGWGGGIRHRAPLDPVCPLHVRKGHAPDVGSSRSGSASRAARCSSPAWASATSLA
jgi:murein DD-endopeptidase MepM/ murein hydrolase activator NlpD